MRHMPAARRTLLFLPLLFGTWCSSFASDCPAGTPVATFNLTVVPPKGGAPLPLSSLNVASSGEKLRYEPVKLSDDLKAKAKVSVIIVPASDSDAKHFKVLAAQPVKDTAEWLIPQTASAIGLIFGSYGVDTKRVTALVQEHPEIITKLADYAEQSTRVEALVQTLSQYEKAPPTGKSLQSVLQGFSLQYGVQLPAFDNKTTSSQQVLGLLNAIAPAVNTPDPLPSRSGAVVKAGGLAESVAVSYFGAPVALTVSGAALVQSLHSSLFPPTNFRSAFAQPSDSATTNLCSAKKEDKETQTRIDYIWMSRIPNQEAPSLSLAADAHIAVGMASPISISAATVAQLESLPRAHNWQLVSEQNVISIPTKITKGTSSSTISLDLSKTKVPAGQYQLAADWDWTPLKVAGTVEVHDLGTIADVRLSRDSRDALITGAGLVRLQLTGTDFEFVDSVALLHPGRSQKADELQFNLPKGKQLGNQQELEAEIDTTAIPPGKYELSFKQINGATGNVPIVVHPPNPELTGTPLRVNVGEPQQTVVLHGKHLDRIEKITSPRAEWTLATTPERATDLTERSAIIKLFPMAQKGEELRAELFVRDLEKPLKVDAIARVAGPRPRITSATKSFTNGSGMEIRDGEIPAGTAVSFAFQAEGVNSRSVITLSCTDAEETRHKLSISSGDKTDTAQFDFTGQGSFYLSVDPGLIGDSGCQLAAVITDAETGASDPFALGRVTRFPHINSFTVTDEKLGDSTYSALLTGRDLQLISKAGWEKTAGEPAQGIPTPVSGNPGEQTLKIAVPWPPPSPKATLYIWLRGERDARRTDARY